VGFIPDEAEKRLDSFGPMCLTKKRNCGMPYNCDIPTGNALNRMATASILNKLLCKWYLIGTLAFALSLQLATIYVPFSQGAFRNVPIDPLRLTYVFAVCFSILIFDEV
jgi:hypothetical protein